jgi:hypothetical protein
MRVPDTLNYNLACFEFPSAISSNEKVEMTRSKTISESPTGRERAAGQSRCPVSLAKEGTGQLAGCQWNKWIIRLVESGSAARESQIVLKRACLLPMPRTENG